MTTLTDIMVEVLRKLGQVNDTIATGGSTTTAIDSTMIGLGEDDQWNNGAIFVISTTDGLAPQGESRLITDYEDASGTFTVGTAFSAAVGGGDSIAYSSSYYPYYSIRASVNAALRKIGLVNLYDDTLTIDPGTGQIPLALNMKRRPHRLQVKNHLDASVTPSQWVDVNNWEYLPAEAGSVAQIFLPSFQNQASVDFRVWYQDYHPPLTNATDLINESVDLEYLILMATAEALTWQNSRLEGGSDYLIQRYNQAMADLTDYEKRVNTPKRETRIRTLPTRV